MICPQLSHMICPQLSHMICPVFRAPRRCPMTRTKLRRESRRMRFEESHGGWEERRLTREEAARLPGACARTFRRYVDRYEEDGLDGLLDRRLSQVSARRPRPMRFRGPRCFTASGMTEGTSCVSTVTIVANMRGSGAKPGSRPSFSVRTWCRRLRDPASIAAATRNRRVGGWFDPRVGSRAVLGPHHHARRSDTRA